MFNMAPQFIHCTEEPSSVIQFLRSENMKTTQIHERMAVQCYDNRMSQRNTFE
jgi:hypothetical protein